MVTLTADSEAKLKEVRKSVSKVDEKNLDNIKDFVNDSLLTALSDPEFFVDNSVKDKLKVTVDSIKECAGLAHDRVAILMAEYNWWASATRKLEIETAIKWIQNTITGSLVDLSVAPLAFKAWTSRCQMSGSFNTKYMNYKKMSDEANKFKYLPDTVSCSHKYGGLGSDLSENLNTHFVSAWTPRYYMIWEDWKEIKPVGWKYKIKMKMDDGSEQDVKVSWIEFVGNTLKIWKDISFEPSNLDVSKPLQFNVAGSFDNVDGTLINVVHMKKFEIGLKLWVLDVVWRGTQFDTYNDSLDPKPIQKALTDTFTDEVWGKKYNHSIEREALTDVLKKFSKEEYDKLSETQKEKFYQRMFRGWWKNKTWWLLWSSKSPRFEEFYNAWAIRQYSTYRDWFVADSKAWNKDPEITKSESHYLAFIKDKASSQDKCKEYIKDALEKQMLDAAVFKLICARFIEFLNEVEENKTDDNLNENIDKNLFKKWRKHKVRMKKWPRSPFHSRDVNYMRFFSWSSKSIKNQEVNIYTQEWVRDKDNPKFKYDLDMNVTWENKIDLKINIEWQDPVSISAGEPRALSRRVLRNNNIGPWKARVHICFNIYKAMIEMAKDKNISLSYRDGKKLKEIYIKDGDIVLEEKTEVWYKADKKQVFSQKVFAWVNDFERWNKDEDDIWVLNRWIEELWKHFNTYMNVYHKKYRRATERRVINVLHSPSRPKLPTSFWLSPIKKILNCKTTTKFDFNDTINVWGKSIQIDFKKNKFTISMDWLKKPISSRDLWKLLNHRERGKRVFDGVEREIVQEIYKRMINKLRENAKVARTNFGVVDNITWNLYVLDKDGNFWYVPKGDLRRFRWHPMRWLLPRLRKSWALLDRNLSYGKINYIKFDPEKDISKINELLENPFLMQRLMRAMNRRMWLKESLRSIFVS